MVVVVDLVIITVSVVPAVPAVVVVVVVHTVREVVCPVFKDGLEGTDTIMARIPRVAVVVDGLIRELPHRIIKEVGVEQGSHRTSRDRL